MLNTRTFPQVMKEAAVEGFADAKAKIVNMRHRLIVAYIVVVSLMATALPSFAQVSIDIQPEDLDVFFDWFNTMFGVILPIALIGAGLVAGATFAFIVGNMLKKAFQSLAGGA